MENFDPTTIEMRLKSIDSIVYDQVVDELKYCKFDDQEITSFLKTKVTDELYQDLQDSIDMLIDFYSKVSETDDPVTHKKNSVIESDLQSTVESEVHFLWDFLNPSIKREISNRGGQ